MSYISEIRKKVGHDPIFMPTAACFVLKDNKLLLQLRTDNYKWGANGGCLEFNETPVEAMKRELQEELGIIATSYKLIGVYAGPEQHMFYPNGDEVYIVTTIFLVDDYDGEIQPNSSEVKEVKWFPIGEKPVKNEINPADYQPLIDTIKYTRKYRNYDKD